MRCPRLLIENADLAAGLRLPAPEDRLHYATRVLRLKDGAACRLFDGRGNEFDARLETAGRRAGVFHLGERAAEPTTPRFPITLLQGIARGDHMDLALQKAVELGVSRIRPVLCERSRSAGGHKGLDRRQSHWQGVIAAAAEQCGRNELPVLEALCKPDEIRPGEAPESGGGDLALLADEAGVPLSRAVASNDASGPDSASLLVGPEGGLTDAERALARDRGFLPVRTGPRTLRTETAAMAMLTLVQWRFGDLEPADADGWRGPSARRRIRCSR
ncbi:16S rRNA (uracil(1498)-N(3))-methyltransferase [Thioalkalivibrio sp. ALR17-21]|uniref:16S rRNA (uracil(1498)-N(3))-methyltransferase n=1 Tax=Thioalkalivibrio sp. ALR17-21 TaxID=1269813 RepID=UPI00042528FC|nr:16S rRNA (uracil(1498)-N(3))-methyltransferase [Thioalkalivibrio sp. ALR17-21]